MPRELARLEGLDDVHASAAARARCRQDARLVSGRLGGLRFGRRRCHGQQLARPGDGLGAVAVGEQAVMPDAMEALGQDVQQESADVASG